MKNLPQPRRLPQRILMTGDGVGGVWTYCLELARGLQPFDIEVALAVMGGPLSQAQRREAAAIPNLEVRDSAYKLEWMDDPWNDLERASDWLLGLEQDLVPDLIHLNTYIHGALPWRAPALMVAHSCVLSWWQAVKNEAAPSSWELYRGAVRRGLEAATLVISPTRAMLNQVYCHYGPLRDGRVIANGLDPEGFTAHPRKSPYIFAAGRLWDEAKNIQALDNVAPYLDWPIYVAGDNRHPGGSRMSSLQLYSMGRLSQPKMKQFLSYAAIYALPARYEPFGLSVLEAALSGCALVLGSIDSLREIWDDAAFFVDPDDLEELFSVLSRLIDSKKTRRNFADRARRRGLNLNTASMIKSYLKAYEDLLQAREHKSASCQISHSYILGAQ